MQTLQNSMQRYPFTLVLDFYVGASREETDQPFFPVCTNLWMRRLMGVSAVSTCYNVLSICHSSDVLLLISNVIALM